ncbi:hypothetical protein MCP1_360005 [Candidatus Terasakiella magnetica]|nr:hypothetical protein MCP1_360005 [Candidatus Terasakiella magnetica]
MVRLQEHSLRILAPPGNCLTTLTQGPVMRIFWQDSMSLGIAALDCEHRELVLLLDQICVAIQSRNIQAGITLLPRFIEVLDSHFLNEEMLIETLRHPEAEDHIAGHRDAVPLVHALISAMTEERDLGQAETAVSTFIAHLFTRLLHQDALLARQLRDAPATCGSASGSS